MIYYRCIVAFALWMTSSIGVINAKEDIDLRRGGAKGLLMRGQEERRIHEGQRELQDPSKSKNAPPYVGCYIATGERKKKRVNGLLSCNSVCSDYDYFALRWSKLKCYCIDGDVGKNTDDSLKSTECWNYANKDTSAPFAVYEVLNPSPTSSAKKTREILSRFYDATNGDEWRFNDGWKDADTSVCKWYGVRCCKWYGVRCNSDDEVTALNLEWNKLSGTIPAELGNMENLEFLKLAHNELTGPIPSELGNMENLESLELYDNVLTGTIPPKLGNLKSLEKLDLQGNDLSGEVPRKVCDMRNTFFVFSIDCNNCPYCATCHNCNDNYLCTTNNFNNCP